VGEPDIADGLGACIAEGWGDARAGVVMGMFMGMSGPRGRDGVGAMDDVEVLVDVAVLKLAFRRHVLDTLARSDGFVHPAERDLVQDLCPDAAMQGAGLMDEFGVLTVAYEEAHQAALRRLPIELSLAERLELLRGFFGMCLVDGQLDRSEGSLLFEAARRLAITPQQFDRFLDEQEEVGEVELDAPVGEEPEVEPVEGQ